MTKKSVPPHSESLLIELLQEQLQASQETNRQLQTVLEQFKASQERLEEQLSKLLDENERLRRMVFGAKSERMPPIKEELEKRSKGKKKSRSEEEKEASRQKGIETRRKNREKKKNIEKVEVEHTFGKSDSQCGKCGGMEFESLGTITSNIFEFVPARLVCQEHVREKRICSCCRDITTAEAPERVGDGALHGPGLHAKVVVSKCLDHQPLHRQMMQFLRQGIPMSDTTLGDLFHRSADLLRPIYQRLTELVRKSYYVCADETRILVQQIEKMRQSWIWAFLAGPIILFVYSFSRSSETASKMLAGTSGFLQADAYQGYNEVCLPNGRKRVGCWAHVRRKFFDLFSSHPRAKIPLDWILALYEVEYRVLEKGKIGTEYHLDLRLVVSKGIIDEFHAWLLNEKEKSPPQSSWAKAVNYALNQWPALTQFLHDPNLLLDNNISERALRCIALGRKNFVSIGNDVAGENFAILQTIVSTCVSCGVEPQHYLEDVLIRINTHPQRRIDELLPMNWKPLSPR